MFHQRAGNKLSLLRNFLLQLLLNAPILLSINSVIAAEVQKTEQPNIVIIFVDDQGYYDLGCYGAGEIQTPNIDSLAAQGIRFTDYYAAAPICSPSRAGLLTGCYPRRIGMETWVQRADSDRGIHPQELTLAELFRDAGYVTGCVGKWHLGNHHEFLPLQQGFSSYLGLLHNLDPVETIFFTEAGGVPIVRGNGEIVKRPAVPAELTRLYTDEAIRFIEQNREQPFLLYLPHTMLHNPLGVSDEFRGSSRWGEYGDAIHELDFHVGRLLDCLKKQQLQDQTILLYASDNGRGPGRNADQPLQGRKLTTWECGIRVPAIISGPAVGIRTGVSSEAIVTAMDWYPSLASLAGIPIPAGNVIDGRDLSPYLLGQTPSIPSPSAGKSINAAVPLRRSWNQPREWSELFTRDEYINAFFYHGSEGQLAAVRSGDWKLVLTPELLLYNLQEDPGERQPLKNQQSKNLRGMAVMFMEEMNRDARQAGRAR